MALPALFALSALAAVGIGLAAQRRAAALPSAADFSRPPPSSSDSSLWFQADDGGMYTLAADADYPAYVPDSLLISDPPESSALDTFASTLIEAAEGAALFLTGGVFDTAARWLKAAREPKNAAYVAAALAAEAANGIPSNLLVRLIWQESRFNPKAVSPAGAVGLMQMIPRWHPTINALDPSSAIAGGARYLREQYDRFGTWELALKAYNAGPTALAQILKGERAESVETKNYSKQIMADVGLTTT